MLDLYAQPTEVHEYTTYCNQLQFVIDPATYVYSHNQLPYTYILV